MLTSPIQISTYPNTSSECPHSFYGQACLAKTIASSLNMADWFRPVWQRTRGSVPSSPSLDRSCDDNEEWTSSHRRPVSRVSSYLNLRGSTPILHLTHPECIAKEPCNVYQPSGDQMAETLRVALMTLSIFEPLPTTYNPCIMHVLEAYQNQKLLLDSKEKDIETLKRSNTRSIKRLNLLTEQWDTLEMAYKADIRRLELLLMRAEGSMDSVMLTRSHSRVHGPNKTSSGFMGSGIHTSSSTGPARASYRRGNVERVFFASCESLQVRGSAMVLYDIRLCVPEPNPDIKQS